MDITNKDLTEEFQIHGEQHSQDMFMDYLERVETSLKEAAYAVHMYRTMPELTDVEEGMDPTELAKQRVLRVSEARKQLSTKGTEAMLFLERVLDIL